MNKTVIILISILTIGSISFLGFNLFLYSSYKKDLQNINNDIKKTQEIIEEYKKSKEEEESLYNATKDENKEKVEVLEKWKIKVEEIKKALQ